MELVNRLKSSNTIKFLGIRTAEKNGDSSYELVLKDMNEGKPILFATFIGVFHKSKGGNIKFTRVSLT